MTKGVLNRRQLLVTSTVVLANSTLVRAHSGTVHVTIENLAFLPVKVEVRVGETIEWSNKDVVGHTATVKGGWEVLIPPGTVATHIATAEDTVDYFCRFHPNMKGQITVKA